MIETASASRRLPWAERHARITMQLGAFLRGSSDSGGPGLSPMPGSLERPEGVRRYLITAPESESPGARALVLVLHGAGASAEQVMGLAFPPSPLSVWLERGGHGLGLLP